jgi:hypothetical protein
MVSDYGTLRCRKVPAYGIEAPPEELKPLPDAWRPKIPPPYSLGNEFSPAAVSWHAQRKVTGSHIGLPKLGHRKWENEG